MTDLHTHILYGIDDGSKDIQESIELLKELSRVGFDKVILTPHYIEGTEYSCNNQEKMKRFEMLKDEIKKNKLEIEVYLGNEIYINDKIIENIEYGNSCTIDNGKYLLFELPMHNKILNLYDIIYEIKYHGYIPILAHPERYTCFQDDYSLVDDLKSEGLLFQANYASILGYYGRGAQKLLKYMLKHKYVDYLGTDIHRVAKNYTVLNFEKIEKEFNKLAGRDYYNQMIKNGDDIINEPSK